MAKKKTKKDPVIRCPHCESPNVRIVRIGESFTSFKCEAGLTDPHTRTCGKYFALKNRS